MSQKKHPQYLVKTTSNNSDGASAVPPRYQPPPQPPTGTSGILKHLPHSQIHPQHQIAPGVHPQSTAQIPPTSSIGANKDANIKAPLPYQNTASSSSSMKPGPEHNNLVKGPPLDHVKFYPSNQHQQTAAGSIPKSAPYLGYPPYADIRVSQPQSQELPTELVARLPPQQLRRYPTDEEFLRNDMLKFVRKSDIEPNSSGPRLSSADSTRHIQGLMNELRILKEANQRLADDNQELRDLCCFLDDDRQKGRKLAREWQRFGRYTASVMRQEVSAYQSKLRELDNKQQELIKDNLELKELCLYLDEERNSSVICPSCGGNTAGGALRDDGDGSSSSTNADEPHQTAGFTTSNGTNINGTTNGGGSGPGPGPGGGNSNSAVNSNPPAPRRTASRERLLHENLVRQRSTFNDQTMQYVRSLEQRVKQLEDEKRALQHKLKGNGLNTEVDPVTISSNSATVLSGRPEAVVRALQVLEVREQLERDGRTPVERVPTAVSENEIEDATAPDMDDGEKALVREMCNVVWRKLEEGPPQRR